MFKTLRAKLTVGFIPILAITVALGLWAIGMFLRLGNNIDVILRENYKSVLAVEHMKEAIERMDSALLFSISGRSDLARDRFGHFKDEFDRHLLIEKGNITVEGEQQRVDELEKEYREYLELSAPFLATSPPDPEVLRQSYFTRLLPKFERIKDLEDQILLLNQKNMESMDQRARQNASASIRLMIVALLLATGLTIVSARILTRFILEPIRAVTMGARAVSRGNLDQVVTATTQDELGELAQAFNQMARTIREFRDAGTARLVRAQRTAQSTIDSFPDPVVVVDLAGAVERANPAAERLINAAPNADGLVPWAIPAALKEHVEEVLAGQGNYLPISLEQSIHLRDGNQDRFFLPRVLGIRGDYDEFVGAAIVLSDVTKFQLVDQLKSNMIATVSHELKTPLTSLQMVVHLLLEEVVGPLTSKQVELLLAARQDSDRLLRMINDLLDITRIEQGRVALDLESVNAAELLQEAMARYQVLAEDSGIELSTSVVTPPDSVLVDRERVAHVFDNLITNAIRHTPRGGSVTLRARNVDRFVEFEVEDTGEGIAREHQPRIFDKFFKPPGARRSEGTGLGLAIVREIITAHGGQIGLESDPGRGTTFRFTLPIAVTDHNGEVGSTTDNSTSFENV